MERKKKFILLTLTSMCLILFACTDKANTNSTGSTGATGTTSTAAITSTTAITTATEQKSTSVSDIVPAAQSL